MSVRLLLSALFILVASRLCAQFHVIQVSGRVQINHKDFAAVGSAFNENATLTYSSGKDALRVVDKNGNVSVFTPPAKLKPVKGVKAYFSGHLFDMIRKNVSSSI